MQPPPGGRFDVPSTSDQDLLAFRCAPALKPYLFGDDHTASIVVDALITRMHEANAVTIPAHLPGTPLVVTVTVGGKPVAHGTVALGSTVELPFSLAKMEPSAAPHTVECTASLLGSSHTFNATSQLFFLPPNPFGANTVKFEARTGALLVKEDKTWTPIFPFGFYTSFDDFLGKNLSILDDVKARGINTIHPVPTFANITVLDQALDRMEELGLWLMYDMRWTYLNDTNVTEEVNHIKSRKNLLLWYTGDEPDGWEDPLDGTTHSYDLINSLDGYHPVSLVLNCENYFFNEYAAGADILMQDTYPFGINATFSPVWKTECTEDYGDCGCDNCEGKIEDISVRMDEFNDRLRWTGRGMSTAVWTVPQAFGGESYWSRAPTGAEYLLENVLSINHGAKGSFAWNHASNTPTDILDAAAILGHSLPSITPFILSSSSTIFGTAASRVDIGSWTQTHARRVLVLATNLNSFAQSATVKIPALKAVLAHAKAQKVLDGPGGGSISLAPGGEVRVSLPATGSVGFVFTW
ncbi:hypothetical protein EXIGLDRAFT_710568 [Exidia glandulosa HHB12029]|uniref:Glycoside hydrolase n=1 Tax=Exidia glandulosa HHB12029 TaxID=1314781 RepID=A0A165H0V3_EXIGL|nr:hypothetical protein EXIGLDRAFT_710568 [Exidia glandulosa HHB12029]